MRHQLQVDPKKYSSISKGFSTIIKEQGASGLLKGWAPTLVGYSLQGACKFGFYEYFKKYVDGLGNIGRGRAAADLETLVAP